ncbi:porin [Collimonas antrihumi]|uniref:porin n=1 Tax=Collimonas antrihumi TaxID=1940615 RepID=UPI001B8D57B3|nr:porin [Collimonas antrihumi]
MKKIMIAVSLLAVGAGVAHAQSNVTIYGVADSYLDFGNNGKQNVSRLQSGGINGSRLGFKGSEDLGGGLRAIYTLEMGINLDDGTSGQGGVAFGRQSWVGLDGRWGALTIGRQYSPLFVTTLKYGMGGGLGWGNASNYFTDFSVATRLNNSINYVSPNLSGFTLRSMYALGENPNAGQRKVGNIASISGQYDNGPLSASLVYLTRNTTTSNTDKWATLGVSYDFGVVKAGLLYQARRDDANLARNNYFEISATKPLGNGSLLVSYGGFQNKLIRNADAKALSLRYDYYLSKRTTVYTGIAKIRNDAKATFGIDGATGSALVVANGNDPRSIIFGIKHAF